MGNSAWFAMILGAALVGVLVILWALAWGDRPRSRLRCPKCWYRMEGIESRTCPECGRTTKNERRLRKTRRRWRGGLIGLAIIALSAGGAGVLLSQNGAWLRATPSWLLLQIVSEPDYTRAKQLIALRGAPQQLFANLTPPPLTGTTSSVSDPNATPPARRTRPPITLQGAQPAAPATLPPADFATQLATELARRHLDGELSPEARRLLARRDVKGLDDLKLHDLITYRKDWLHGVVMRPKTHPTNVRATVPSTPFQIRFAIIDNGERVTDTDSSHYFINRVTGAGVGPPATLRFEVLKGHEYEVEVAVVDASGDAASITLPMPINVYDQITDIFLVVDDERIALLRDDTFTITFAPEPIGYDIYVTEHEGPLPPITAMVLESGPPDRASYMHTARLGKRHHPAWPKYSFGIPLYARETANDRHTWPLRLVNHESALLHDPDAQFCLPPGGIELDFGALLHNKPTGTGRPE